jgi:hypothetical protein
MGWLDYTQTFSHERDLWAFKTFEITRVVRSRHPLAPSTDGQYSFVPLVPEKHTSFASRISMTQDNTMDLFKYLNADPSFIMNFLGRPDYWAPQTRWTSDSNGNISACGPLHQTVA